MLLGHLLDHQKTDAGAFGSLGGEELVEDLQGEILGDSFAVILDLEDGVSSVVFHAPYDNSVSVLLLGGVESAGVN